MTRYNIFQDGKKINCILSDAAFIEEFCSKNGYTYAEDVPPEEPEKVSLEERVSALEDAVERGLNL